MPLADPTFVAACFLVPVSFCVGCVLGFFLYRIRARSESRAGISPDRQRYCRACQYCRTGEALLVDETIRVESGELVETKCYVCASCGLPQWLVTRTRAMGRASR
jgi:hypothetical protein